MKGIIHNLKINSHDCEMYLPQEYYMGGKYYPVVYMNSGYNLYEIIGDIESHFGIDCNPFILVNVQAGNWNDDYTPWPAPALLKENEDFGGRAQAYIYSLTNEIKPFIDGNYQTKPDPENTAIIGYSLGGLAALYAFYTCGVFSRVGSLSGSLWYDGWVEFMDNNMPLNTDSKVYLSLGKGEERSRNRRMARVGNCTRKAAEILTRQLSFKENLILEWNNGGHFTEIPKRYHRALLWLMQTNKT